MFRSSPYNFVEYFLNSKLGRRKITDPENWDSDYMEIKKSVKPGNAGIVNKISSNIVFVKNGADYLEETLDSFGSEEEVTLEKFSNHPKKLKKIRSYKAYLGMNKYKLKDGKVKVPAEESSLLSKINTYKSESVELERLESLDGNTLAPLRTHTVAVPGKKIFKQSFLNVAEEDNFTDVWRMDFGSGNYRVFSLPIPISLTSSNTYTSDVSIFQPSRDLFIDTIPEVGESGMVFYLNSDRDRKIEIDFKVYCEIIKQDITNITNGFFKISLIRFNNGDNLDFVGRDDIYIDPSTGNLEDLDGRVIDITTKRTVDLLQGESLGLQFYGGGNFGSLFPDGKFKIDFDNMDASINVEEDSYFDASNNKILLPHERFERLLQIITGRTDDYLFRSEYFGRKDLGYVEDGPGAYLGVSTGFWARGFDDKNITTTWKDTLQTYFAKRNISFGMERKGDTETIVVEPLSYFYQTGKVFDFPLQAKKIERSVANEFQYSSIDIGSSEGGGGYEEIMGLDDPNGKHNYATPFKRDEKKYNLISKDRDDMTGFEIARRKPISSHPTEDTRYDTKNFLMDCIIENGFIRQKFWQDIFSTQPTGIYSPETAGNLDLTPKRCLQRHGWWLNGGLFRYRDQNLIYGSSEGNSELMTQKAGEIQIYENGNLPISILEAPKFKTLWVTFQHKIDFELNELINGSTEVNGRLIPNIYFEWRFINDQGKYEKCRIIEVKPKGSGKIKVLKV